MRRATSLVFFCSGCVLFVSPSGQGPHCLFAGENTQCGACLVERCRVPIDDACADAETLTALERCADGRDCGALTARETVSPAAACALTNCRGVCRTLSGTSRTACDEAPLARGAACSCKLAAPGNDFLCDRAAYPASRCCAPRGWPAEGLTCQCNTFNCFSTSDGCACSLVSSLTGDSVCRAAFCCVEGNTCRCRSRPCYDFEKPVPGCSIDAVGCDEGQISVESCSVR